MSTAPKQKLKPASENICFLFTKKYPFGKTETYVHYEIDYLIDQFSRIIIIPIEEYEYGESRIQENHKVSIFRVNQNIPRRNFFQKITSRLKNHGLLLQILFHSREKLKTLLHWNLYAVRLVHLRAQSSAIERLFNENSVKKNVVFYHYWLHNSVVTQHLAKIRPYLSVARAHALDLYHKDWPSEDKASFLQFEKIKIQTCDLIFSISQHGMHHFKKTFPAFQNKFILNRLGIEDKNTEFTPKSLIKESASGCYLVVTCSNLTPRKRLPLMPSILCHLKNPCKWIHIGGSEGSEITFLKEECTRLGIEFEFKAQQPSDAILQFYRETPISLFCNLSYAEGIPVSMMEAAMFGIPLLATDTFGNPEIANNENGILIPIDFNPQQVALQIDQMLNDSAGWAAKSLQSRNIYLDRYQSAVNMRDFISHFVNPIYSSIK